MTITILNGFSASVHAAAMAPNTANMETAPEQKLATENCLTRFAVSAFAVQIGVSTLRTSACPISRTGRSPMIGKA
mgnify:CR=1 FL=1